MSFSCLRPGVARGDTLNPILDLQLLTRSGLIAPTLRPAWLARVHFPFYPRGATPGQEIFQEITKTTSKKRHSSSIHISFVTGPSARKRLPPAVPWRENPLGNKEIFRIERDVVSCLYDFDFLAPFGRVKKGKSRTICAGAHPLPSPAVRLAAGWASLWVGVLAASR